MLIFIENVYLKGCVIIKRRSQVWVKVRPKEKRIDGDIRIWKKSGFNRRPRVQPWLSKRLHQKLRPTQLLFYFMNIFKIKASAILAKAIPEIISTSEDLPLEVSFSCRMTGFISTKLVGLLINREIIS